MNFNEINTEMESILCIYVNFNTIDLSFNEIDFKENDFIGKRQLRKRPKRF